MRKVKNLLVLMMAVMAVVMLSSCGGDDDNVDVLPGAAKIVAGNYVATMNCEVMKQLLTYENVSVSIVAKDDATVDIKVSSFGEGGRKLDPIEINDVKVTGEDGNYAITSKEFSGTTENGKAYSGVVTGTYVAGKLSLVYSLQYGSMPMPMQNTFEAQKTTE
jgi:uncharacterized lipoprotein YehR (DUF1307 family)